MELDTLTTGAGVDTTIELTWVPQFIFYVAATQLQAFRATVLGDGVIANLDANGLDSLGNVGVMQRVTNGTYIYLADGIMKNRNITLTFTNSAAQTPTVYGAGIENGRVYIQNIQARALQSSGVTLTKFLAAGFPNAAAADEFNITYRRDKTRKNLTQKWNRIDIQAQLGMEQFVRNGSADYTVRNMDQRLKEINFIPAASQQIYVMRVAARAADGAIMQEL